MGMGTSEANLSAIVCKSCKCSVLCAKALSEYFFLFVFVFHFFKVCTVSTILAGFLAASRRAPIEASARSML